MALQFFTETFQASLLKMIKKCALERTRPEDKSRIYISDVAYADAFSEADFDAHFIKQRSLILLFIFSMRLMNCGSSRLVWGRELSQAKHRLRFSRSGLNNALTGSGKRAH